MKKSKVISVSLENYNRLFDLVVERKKSGEKASFDSIITELLNAYEVLKKK